VVWGLAFSPLCLRCLVWGYGLGVSKHSLGWLGTYAEREVLVKACGSSILGSVSIIHYVPVFNRIQIVSYNASAIRLLKFN